MPLEQVRRGQGEAEVLRLAAIQHGHVHRRQLLEAGIGRGAIAHRLRTGWLSEPFPSVYRIAGAPHASRLGRAMAAVLLFRGSAIVRGLDAAAIWQMLDTTQEPPATHPIELLLVGGGYKPRPGIVVSRIKSLAATDIAWRNRIPVTSPALTIRGLAAQLDDLDLEAVLSAAFRRRLVRTSLLNDVMRRHPYAKGIRRLRALLEQAESLHDTRSRYERKLFALLRAAQLPLPLTNVEVAGKLVDGVWPDVKLVYEFDGWLYHRDKFEGDRLRDQHVLASGHQVIRITRLQVDVHPYALIARIAGMIATLRLRPS